MSPTPRKHLYKFCGFLVFGAVLLNDMRHQLRLQHPFFSSVDNGRSSYAKASINGSDMNQNLTCLVPPLYGRLNNQIISIAGALREARKHNTTLILGEQWNEIFLETFDPHPDVFVPLSTSRFHFSNDTCQHELTGKRAFRLARPLETYFLPELAELLLRKDICDKAKKLIEDNYYSKSQKSVISVHRRWLEGECYKRAKRAMNFGSVKTCSAETMLNACNVKYDDIDTPGSYSIVVLFTDGQMPAMDDTFPIRDPAEKKDLDAFKIQMWMMALSDIHYGNPASSVDWVVMHWRYKLRNSGATSLHQKEGETRLIMEPSSTFVF